MQKLLETNNIKTAISRGFPGRTGRIDLKSNPEDKVLTIQELAEYLKLSLSTAYKLAQEGKIPGQKVGKHWRFHRDVIDRWLDQNRPDDSVDGEE